MTRLVLFVPQPPVDVLKLMDFRAVKRRSLQGQPTTNHHAHSPLTNASIDQRGYRP